MFTWSNGSRGRDTGLKLATAMYLGDTEQARLDDAIRSVASGLSSVVGEEFFHSLVLLLAGFMALLRTRELR